MTAPASVRPLLLMLEDLLRSHETSSPGSTRVLPCLTDNLSDDIGVITAVVHAAGGTVLNTARVRALRETPGDTENYGGPVPGRSGSAVASALSASVRYRRAGTELGIQITDAGAGLIDAAYTDAGPTSAIPPPPADDPLLALVRALCSERLQSSTGGLAMIVYDEADLDANQRETAWGLSVLVRDLSLGPRTVVLLAASAEIDVPRHVGNGLAGFRYSRNKGQLVRRNPPEARGARVADILRGSGRFTGMFLGAGFSTSSGLLLGNGLRDEALVAQHTSPAGAGSDQLAADWYRHIEDMGALLESEKRITLQQRIAGLTLERVLREEYRKYSPEPPPTLQKFRDRCAAALTTMGGAPRSLASIIDSDRKLVVCTVNFDQLVEAAATPGAFRVFFTDSDFAVAPQYLRDYLDGVEVAVPLLKLHGSIEDLNSCVASDDRTLLGLSPAKRDTLAQLLDLMDPASPTPWLYVGASMRDADLTAFWSAPEFAERTREWWVLPFAVESVDAFIDAYRQERWSQHGSATFTERLITETADTFLKSLADAMADL